MLFQQIFNAGKDKLHLRFNTNYPPSSCPLGFVLEAHLKNSWKYKRLSQKCCFRSRHWRLRPEMIADQLLPHHALRNQHQPSQGRLQVSDQTRLKSKNSRVRPQELFGTISYPVILTISSRPSVPVTTSTTSRTTINPLLLGLCLFYLRISPKDWEMYVLIGNFPHPTLISCPAIVVPFISLMAFLASWQRLKMTWMRGSQSCPHLFVVVGDKGKAVAGVVHVDQPPKLTELCLVASTI